MKSTDELFVPALKGFMGDKFYYVTLMTLGNIADRIKVGSEIYRSKKLSDMIQRELRKGRDKQIAEYLIGENERFFNAMVVGVYGGKPEWKPFTITAGVSEVDASSLRLDTINSFGFLKLSGKEVLFPLDGQHRLAGIRAALKRPEAVEAELSEEEVTVIFLAHDDKTAAGRERSRRLFTVLNKRAKAVDKNEIIALDEDDVMAIVTRDLVEHYAPLKEDRILFTASGSMQPTGQDAFTTIGTLYNSLAVIFAALSGASKSQLESNRPPEALLSYYLKCARAYFSQMALSVDAFSEFSKSATFGKVSAKYRNNEGGHLLFRPAGLLAFSEVVAAILKDEGFKVEGLNDDQLLILARRASAALKSAVAEVASLPLLLTEEPCLGTIWNSDTNKMQANRKTLLRDLMLDMLKRYDGREELRSRYAAALGKDGERIRLPSEKRLPRLR